MNRLRILLVFLTIVALLLGGWAAVLFIDTSPPNPDPLFVEGQKVAASYDALTDQNGYPILAAAYPHFHDWRMWGEDERVKINEMIDEYEALNVSWGYGATEDDAAVITKNRVFIAALDEALRQPCMARPVGATWEEQVLLGSACCDILELRVAEALRMGRSAEAVRLAIDMVHFGHRWAKRSNYVGAVICFNGCTLLRSIAALPEVDVGTLKQIREALSSFSFTEELRTDYWHMYYHSVLSLDDKDELADREGNYKRNRTHRALRALFDASIAELQAGAAQEVDQLHRDFLRERWGSPTLAMARGNSIGFEIVQRSLQWLRNHTEKQRRLHLAIEATRTRVALRMHQLREGRYPDTLDDLVPEYLPTVPKDPFTGAALLYDASSQRIPSIDARESRQAKERTRRPWAIPFEAKR